jgi:hypothetical protein
MIQTGLQFQGRNLMAKYKKSRTRISPRTIEAVAIASFVIVVLVGVWALIEIPKQEFNRAEILKTIEAIIGGLGISSLLLVWAQLRHTAILGKLTSYHDHFHDLPSIGKVRDLYKVLGRCKVEVPSWHAPMSDSDRANLIADAEPAPDTAELVIREYLNDFEEFASAINCGLVDEDYAYRIESTRVLSAHFGFRKMVNHWHAKDKEDSERSGGAVPITTDYYGELLSVAERWKLRKEGEQLIEEKAQEKRRIAERL